MRARYLFVVLFVCLSPYGCASRSISRQMCSPELDASLAEGTLLLVTESQSGETRWQTLDLKTGSLRPYDVLNNTGEQLLSPPRVSDVSISLDGKKLAYQTYLQEEGYIISSRDGVSTVFAPLEKFNLVYVPESQEWFIIETNARTPKPLIYPLTPTGDEERISYSIRQSIPGQIATQWIARLGTREIPTLAIVSSDGKELRYFPDRLNEWQQLEGWLNDSDLQLTNYATADFSSPYVSQTLNSDQTLLLNWQTGEKLVSGDNLPDKYFLTWAPVYSPSKRYVAYLGQQGKHLVIFDRTKNEIVSEISIQSTVPFAPLWIDESRLIVVIRDESTRVEHLFILDKNGNLQQIHLEMVEHPAISSLLLPQLSFDKRLISFWLTDQREPTQSKLLFLDIERRRIYDFCFSANGMSNIGQGWLPRQYRFAFSVQHNDTTEIVIIDVLHRKMFSMLIPYKAVLGGAIALP